MASWFRILDYFTGFIPVLAAAHQKHYMVREFKSLPLHQENVCYLAGVFASMPSLYRKDQAGFHEAAAARKLASAPLVPRRCPIGSPTPRKRGIQLITTGIRSHLLTA
jgi:hypothetical protein